METFFSRRNNFFSAILVIGAFNYFRPEDLYLNLIPSLNLFNNKSFNEILQKEMIFGGGGEGGRNLRHVGRIFVFKIETFLIIRIIRIRCCLVVKLEPVNLKSPAHIVAINDLGICKPIMQGLANLA